MSPTGRPAPVHAALFAALLAPRLPCSALPHTQQLRGRPPSGCIPVRDERGTWFGGCEQVSKEAGTITPMAPIVDLERTFLSPAAVDGSQHLKDRLEHEWERRAKPATVSLARLIRHQATACAERSLESHFGRRITKKSNCSQQLPGGRPLFAKHRVSHGPKTGAKAEPLANATLRVVNAGLGKTATHAFFEEMCAAGFKAIHWDLTCNELPKEAIQANLKILSLHNTLKKCAAGEWNRTHKKCNAVAHLDILKRTLATLLTSGVEALSDAPYTDLVPYVQELVPNVRIAQTLRDPMQYAFRRIQWLGGTDTICKDPEATGGATHWDTIGCLSGVTYVADALTTHAQMFRHTAREKSEDSKSAIGVFAAKFVLHNNYIERNTAPERLCQLCAWDSDIESALDTMAKAMICSKMD